MGAKQYHQATPYNKPHTRDLLGQTQENACLSLARSIMELSRRQTIYRVSLGRRFPARELVRFQVKPSVGGWDLELRDWWVFGLKDW